jgi:hypothetical protein
MPQSAMARPAAHRANFLVFILVTIRINNCNMYHNLWKVSAYRPSGTSSFPVAIKSAMSPGELIIIAALSRTIKKVPESGPGSQSKLGFFLRAPTAARFEKFQQLEPVLERGRLSPGDPVIDHRRGDSNRLGELALTAVLRGAPRFEF